MSDQDHDRDAGRTDEAPAPGADDQARTAREARGTPLTQQVGRAVLILAAGIFAIFAIVNSQHVDFNWVFGSTEVDKAVNGDRVSGGVPLIILLIAAFGLGIVVAWLATLRSERRKRKRGD